MEKRLQPFVPMNMQHECPAGHFFNRPKLPFLSDRVYGPLRLLNIDLDPLTYRDDSLNLAASYIRYFVKNRHRTTWFHVMIRGVAVQSFVDALDADCAQTRTLPFSCWCDGGGFEEYDFRQHRHWIVVSLSKTGFLSKVWDAIEALQVPGDHFEYKSYETIKSPLHLMNVIGDLSRHKSRCNFSFDHRGEKFESIHYAIGLTLPVDYRYVLAFQWSGGFLQVFDRFFKNMNRAVLLSAPIENSDGRWRIRIADIPNLPIWRALPLSKGFEPTSQKTDSFIYLSKEKKMYFSRGEGNPEEFFCPFLEMANLFWCPPPALQRYLNANRELIKKMADMRKMTKLSAKGMEEEKKKKKKEEVSSDTMKVKLEMELETKNKELEAKIEELETKNKELEAKIEELETKNKELEAKN